MPLEFGNNFCTPCEPITRIWHKGNDLVGRRPIAVVDEVDVDLPEIHAISLLSRYLTFHLLCQLRRLYCRSRQYHEHFEKRALRSL